MYFPKIAANVFQKSEVDFGLRTSTIESLDKKKALILEQLMEEKLIRICLHGIAEVAAINLLPNALNYGKMMVGESSTREVRITNQSHILPIYIRYIKIQYLQMTPEEFVLEPKKSREVAFKLQPYLVGNYCFIVLL